MREQADRRAWLRTPRVADFVSPEPGRRRHSAHPQVEVEGRDSCLLLRICPRHEKAEAGSDFSASAGPGRLSDGTTYRPSPPPTWDDPLSASEHQLRRVSPPRGRDDKKERVSEANASGGRQASGSVLVVPISFGLEFSVELGVEGGLASYREPTSGRCNPSLAHAPPSARFSVKPFHSMYQRIDVADACHETRLRIIHHVSHPRVCEDNAWSAAGK